ATARRLLIRHIPKRILIMLTPRISFVAGGSLLAAALALASLAGCGNSAGGSPTASGTSLELLNVSYDPTRELWRAINEQFARDYQERTGTQVTIKQSHGGSSSQARAVIDGL